MRNRGYVGRSKSSFVGARSIWAMALLAMSAMWGFSLAAIAEDLVFSAARPLNANAATDTASDSEVCVATDNAGHWVAVWSTIDYTSEPNDSDILVARSVDNGFTWSVPVPLHADATLDSADDACPQIVHDSDGNWVVSWIRESRQCVIGTARSTDGGQTWSEPTWLDSRSKEGHRATSLSLTTDGLGTCVQAWCAHEMISTGTSSYPRIRLSRSTDHGGSWSNAILLEPVLTMDNRGVSDSPSIATDGQCNWLVVWQYRQGYVGGEYGDDYEIYVSRSADNGVTWTAQAVVNSDAAQDTGHNSNPSLVTDRLGNWVIVWGWNSSRFKVARSRDNGVTWSGPHLLDPNLSWSTNYAPQLTTDRQGLWLVLWTPTPCPDCPDFYAGSVMALRSDDDGVSWTGQTPVRDTNPERQGSASGPRAVHAADGTWLVAWSGSLLDGDREILMARDGGEGAGPGDVDHDGAIDAVDVQIVINTCLGMETLCNCDINGDGVVNATDLQLAINAAMGAK